MGKSDWVICGVVMGYYVVEGGDGESVMSFIPRYYLDFCTSTYVEKVLSGP